MLESIQEIVPKMPSHEPLSKHGGLATSQGLLV